jgi:putative oxidoreductase
MPRAVEEYAVTSAFDFTDGYAVLRVLCGAFFIPHVVGKITARQASVAFFELAGLNPPQLWSYAAMALEVVLAACLVLGILTVYAAYMGCIYLLIAAAVNYKVSRKWLWHIGGSEWPVFWALCCAVVGHYGAR